GSNPDPSSTSCARSLPAVQALSVRWISGARPGRTEVFDSNALGHAWECSNLAQYLRTPLRGFSTVRTGSPSFGKGPEPKATERRRSDDEALGSPAEPRIVP